MKNSLLRPIWVVWTLVLSSCLATAQVTVRGRVSDKDGKALQGTFIKVDGTIRGVADAAGEYAIELTKGQYKLSAYLLGFGEKQLVVRVGDKPIRQDFVLEEDYKLLREVVVSAPTYKEVMQNSSFSATSIDVHPLVASVSNLNKLVNQSSGVVIREEGGVGSDFDLAITGLSGNAIRYFVNGVPLSSLGSGVTLANIPINLVERMEIYKGVVPPELGLDALGGAVNIVTKSSHANYLDVSAEAGSFHTYGADVNGQYQLNRSGLTLRGIMSVKSSKNDYLMRDVEVWNEAAYEYQLGDYRRFHDGYRSLFSQLELGFTGRTWADEAFVGISYTSSASELQTGFSQNLVIGQAHRDRSALRFSGRYSKRDLFVDGLSLNLFASHTNDHILYTDTAYRRYAWDGSYVETNYSELMRRGKMIRATERPTDVLRANIAYQWSRTGTVSFNYTLTANKNKRTDRLDATFIPSEDYLARHILGVSYGQYLWDDRINTTLFLKDYIFHAEVEQSDYYWITGANEVERKATKNHLGYGLGVRATLFPELSLKGSYERAVRLPSAREYMGNGANIYPNLLLRPEQANNFNLEVYGAWRFQPEHKLSYKGNFFVRDVQDYIHRVVSSDTESKYENVGVARVIGGEAEVGYTYQHLLDFSVNATYIDERNRSKTKPNGQLDITYDNRIPNKPFFYTNALAAVTMMEPFGLKHSSLRIDGSLSYTHWFYLTWAAFGLAESKALVPNQWNTNVGATLSLADNRYSLSLQCNNLFDRINYDNYMLQKPGRALFCKLKVFIN
ncbi:TonB-dependent receptor [Porphyromonas levii]|uniref:TonB-dependent receptor n=1 Tax=Porphyromonas levii TaxID=28114 RepID=UPI00201270FE|nr:TonB-dependent receptor [Porphyromonas levii]MBR8802907.1 Vitamin B12 transporter BtuB [Porphyromonas levii]